MRIMRIICRRWSQFQGIQQDTKGTTKSAESSENSTFTIPNGDRSDRALKCHQIAIAFFCYSLQYMHCENPVETPTFQKSLWETPRLKRTNHMEGITNYKQWKGHSFIFNIYTLESLSELCKKVQKLHSFKTMVVLSNCP